MGRRERIARLAIRATLPGFVMSMAAWRDRRCMSPLPESTEAIMPKLGMGYNGINEAYDQFQLYGRLLRFRTGVWVHASLL